MIKRLIKTVLFIPALFILLPIDIMVWFFTWQFTGKDISNAPPQLFSKLLNW